MSISALHRAAREYARSGLPVFPCISDAQGRTLPPKQRKKPACPHGHKEATTDLKQIDKWWAENPSYNIGIDPHGAGCCVIDAEHDAPLDFVGKLPRTYTVETPHGGHHYWFEGILRNSVGQLAPRVDTRGNGDGYVLVPPSVVDGRPYRLTHSGEVAPLPAWVTLSGKAKPLKNGHDVAADLPVNVARAITYLHGLEPAREKQGANNAGYKAACELRDLGLSADKTFEVMLEHFKCEPKDQRYTGFLQTVIANAFEYATNAPGVHATKPASQAFAKVAEKATEEAEANAGLIMRSFAEIKMERLEWLWLNRFPRGKVSLVAGDIKLGKTTTLLDMAARISTGANWPDTGKAPKGSVIYFSAEDDPADTIKPRLLAAGADVNKIHWVDAVPTEDGKGRKTFHMGEDLPRLEHALRKLKDVQLVILDPISSYFGSKADTYKNSEVRAVLEPLVKFASYFRVAIIGNTHVGKSGKGKTANMRILDSRAITATVRSIYMVTRDPEDQHRRLFLPGGSTYKPTDGLAFTISEKMVSADGIVQSGSLVQWEESPVTDSVDDIYAELDKEERKRSPTLTDATDWLRAFLADGPKHSATVWTAAEANGFKEMTMRRAAKKIGVMREKGNDMNAGWIMKLPR